MGRSMCKGHEVHLVLLHTSKDRQTVRIRAAQSYDLLTARSTLEFYVCVCVGIKTPTVKETSYSKSHSLHSVRLFGVACISRVPEGNSRDGAAWFETSTTITSSKAAKARTVGHLGSCYHYLGTDVSWRNQNHDSL